MTRENSYATLDADGQVPLSQLGNAPGASVTVEEVDGTPSVAATTLVFPNGTLTDNGSGEVEYTPADGGGSDIDANGVLALELGTPPTVGVSDKVLLYADHLPVTGAIPTMTSDTTPSGTASSSSAYSAYPTWHAFGPSLGGWLTNGTVTGWLRYQFGTAKTIATYKMRPWYQAGETARAIKTWTFEGSNDGSSWTTLDTQTNYTWVDYSSLWEFTIASPGSYTYYRVNISANWGDASFSGIGQLQMYPAAAVGLFAMASDGSVWHQ